MSEKRGLQEIIKWEKRYQAFGLEKLCAWDFAHDNGQNPAATGVARKYADHFEELRQDGTGLSIFGGAGAGKSYLAAEIVSDLTDRGYHCLFTNMNTVMIELNTMAFEGRRDFLAQIDLRQGSAGAGRSGFGTGDLVLQPDLHPDREHLPDQERPPALHLGLS